MSTADHVYSHFKHDLTCPRTVLIVLYRPYILGRPADVAPSENEAWHSKAMSRVKAAASKTTTLLNQFVIMDAIKTCPPTMSVHISACFTKLTNLYKGHTP
jgi:hypothetical protein